MSEPRDFLDDLIGDARAVIEHERSSVAADFAAVLARADRSAAPTEGIDNVVALHGRARTEDAPVADALDGLLGDAREAVDHMVAQRRMRPIPELAATRVQPRRRGSIALGVALLAAAVVAVLGGLQWVDSLRPAAVDDTREQAFSSQVVGGPDGVAHEIEPVPERPRAPTMTPPVEAIAPLAVPVIPAPLERTRPRPSADRLRELADLAHARWRAGDRAGAEQRFERIVQLGGRSSAAELAYGDLFALARQLHDAGKQRTRWRAYLKRFPTGRFADDARAGLCRTGTDASCWRDYLRDFPRGSYRSEATRAVEKVGP